MKKIIYWLISVVKFLFLHKRFLLIFPPFIKSQIFFDRKNMNFFHIQNRNSVDWYTNKQVFIDEQFSWNFLISEHVKRSRVQDIDILYKQIISSNKQPFIIDCGSNNGASSLYFHQCFPEARIQALEIDKGNYLQSKANTQRHAKSIEVINKGVGSRDGFGAIDDPGMGNNAFRVDFEKSNGLKVEIVSINTLLANKSEFWAPFIIKIDIEGGESDLFSSSTEWINKFPIVIIETHDWLFPKENSSLNFLKCISKLDRDFVFHGENIFSICNNFEKKQI